MSTQEDPERKRYELILVSAADTRPDVVRLRLLLKTALRQFGLRCVGIRELRQDKRRQTEARNLAHEEGQRD